MFCRNCGKSMPDNQRYCTECGTEMLNAVNNTYNQSGSFYNYQPNYNCTSTTNNVPEYRATPDNYNVRCETVQVTENGQGMAIASFVLGLVSIVGFSLGIIPAALSTFFGCVSKSQGSKSAMATAGLVCSAVGAVISVISLL